MWPLWLIIASATGGAITLTVSGVLLAVYVERNRHRKLIAQNNRDCHVSQLHRSHLSITDVDFAGLPQPTQSLRQGIVSPRKDSRFYSTMPSEDKIRAFPDGNAESVAEACFVHTGAEVDRSHQRLSPPKSEKKDKRKKKLPVFSIAVPMARSPLSAVSEVTEPERAGSPDPVELPTHTMPKVTPERPIDHQNNPMPTHAPHRSIDSILNNTGRNTNQVSQRIGHGHALKARSDGVGSINVSPPNCPLPPVPRNMPKGHSRTTSHARVKLNISTEHQGISLLNTPLSPKDVDMCTLPLLNKSQLKDTDAFSGFDFGLRDGTIQIIRVEPEQKSYATKTQSGLPNALCFAPAATARYPPEESFKTIDANKLNLPRGPWHLGSSTPNLSANNSETGSRPVSSISLTGYNGPNSLITAIRSPTNMSLDPPSRPISISSVDIFRNSVVRPNAPVLAPEPPRSRGHKRQNCVRISGLTPIDAAKRRLSSQLRRLSEAGETDLEDTKSISTEVPTVCPARPTLAAAELPVPGATLDVPRITQPQALSLRTKRPGAQFVRNDRGRCPPQADIITNSVSQQPAVHPQNQLQVTLSCSKTMEPHFVYQGSPSSDPTKPPPQKQEYSPISPSSLVLTPEKKQPQPQMTYSPASPSMLNSPTISAISTRRNKTQLHGPRNIPPPSLRTRNRTSPGLHLSERSGSPIRKTSASNTHKQRNTSQDDIKRSLALFKRLNHAAQSSLGLPEVNVLKSNPVHRSDGAISRTLSSHFAESPALSAPAQRPRQRSKTVGGNFMPNTFDLPRARPEMTIPRQQQQQQQPPPKDIPPAGARFSYSSSNISIWEDASAKGDSPKIPTKPTPQSVSRTKLADAAKTAISVTAKSGRSLKKESLWKLQQNADLTTSRALAFGSNPSEMNSKSSPKDTTVSKVADGYWGARSEVPTSDDLARIRENISQVSGHPTSRKRSESTVSNVPDRWPNTAATGYGAPGLRSRQRSHTVAANPKPTNGMDIRTKEGVGLGVDFGRTGLETKFLNDMERDGIGRLR